LAPERRLTDALTVVGAAVQLPFAGQVSGAMAAPSTVTSTVRALGPLTQASVMVYAPVVGTVSPLTCNAPLLRPRYCTSSPPEQAAHGPTLAEPLRAFEADSASIEALNAGLPVGSVVAVGAGVLVAGIGVLVAGIGVLVGGTGVLVGGTGVLVGGTGVLVAGIGAFTGGVDVLVRRSTAPVCGARLRGVVTT